MRARQCLEERLAHNGSLSATLDDGTCAQVFQVGPASPAQYRGTVVIHGHISPPQRAGVSTTIST
jgi:hypothetical protein